MEGIEIIGEAPPLAGERLKPLGHLSEAVSIRSKGLNASGFWRIGCDMAPASINRFRPAQDQNSLGKPGKIRGECSADVPRPEVRRPLIKSLAKLSPDQRGCTDHHHFRHHYGSMACGPNVQLSSIGELA